MKTEYRFYSFTPRNATCCVEEYREIQYINGMLNDSFEIYLAVFPSVLLFALSILLYGTLRFWHLDIITYSNFPACGFRCILEIFTIIVLAGRVNKECKDLLEKWDCCQSTENLDDQETRNLQAFLIRFNRSCQVISCKSGPFYSFETPILLCTISNVLVMTLNIWLLTA